MKKNRNIITLECLLVFDKIDDKNRVLELMRKFPSAMRYAYKRLLEGKDRNELQTAISKKYKINTRYSGNAIFLADQMIESCPERGQNPRKIIFGSREIFEKLKKNHLTGKRRAELRQKWEERRHGHLYSRGERSKEGNLNLRFVDVEGEWYLRINVGERDYVFAKVVRKVERDKDRWISFIWDLTRAKASGIWFPYSVRLKLRNGKIYAQVSIEESLPPITITREKGVIGIDINAYPFHLALAFTTEEGNLKGYERINLNELLEGHSDKREYLSWQIAHQVVQIAKREGKAIVMEDLEKLPEGRRGDGMPELRRKKQKWIYKGLLEKIEITAKRNGVQVVKVNPAYTSIIGKIKYAPQFNIDKDIAGAFVIARRGLGFKERLPENYQKLLEDKEFLSHSIAQAESKIAETREKLKTETNEYKQNRLKSRLRKLRSELKLLLLHTKDSGKSETASQQTVNREMERVRGGVFTPQKSWQVLSTAFAFSCLEGFRDLSPLKRVILSGDWVRVASRASPSIPGQGTAVQDNLCSFAQFG